MTWRKKFNIDNKGNDDLRPGQRLIVYALHNNEISPRASEYPSQLESWLWNLTPNEFEKVMNWSPSDS
jgi:hypothetical protein